MRGQIYFLPNIVLSPLVWICPLLCVREYLSGDIHRAAVDRREIDR
jgi:hypothetical protein